MALKIKLFSDNTNRVWAGSAAPCLIPYKGHIFWCAEQLAKYRQSKSKEYRGKILTAYTLKALVYLTKPDTLKEMGFKIDPNYDADKAMLIALRLKFQHNPVAAQALLDTGSAKLTYDAVYDDHFGTGKNGTGEDKMARLLEKVREELRTGKLQVMRLDQPPPLEEDDEDEAPAKVRKPGRNRSRDYDEKDEPRRKNTGKKVVKKKTATEPERSKKTKSSVKKKTSRW